MRVVQRFPSIAAGFVLAPLSLTLATACGDDGSNGSETPSTPPFTTSPNPSSASPSSSNPNPVQLTQNPIVTPDAGSAQPAESGQWCAAKAVFDKHCTTCHDGKGSFGSPFALLTLADFKKDAPGFPGKKIYERAGVRIHDTSRPMPPQAEVPAADKAILDKWIAAGAPGSDSEMCAPIVKPVETQTWPPADCEETYKLLANDGRGGKFSARTGQYYQDFMITPPWQGEVQAVGFRAVVDNKKVLHHYILYNDTGAFLVGWSPGKNDHVLPKDVGVYLPSTGQMKLTVHYYNVQTGATAQPDASGVEICVARTKKRPKTAAIMPFAANPSVPANATRVERKSTCTVSSSEPVTIITSSPHMHELGVHAKFTIQRANGTTEVIHDKPFNFEEQTTHSVNFVVNNGDRVTTTCFYTNPTSRSVSFGTKTEDEMCFNFSMYYPMCAMTCLQEDPLAAAWSLSQGGGCPK